MEDSSNNESKIQCHLLGTTKILFVFFLPFSLVLSCPSPTIVAFTGVTSASANGPKSKLYLNK